MERRYLRFFLFLVLVLGMSACDLFGDEGPPPPEEELQPGTFRAQATGGVETELEGSATFLILDSTSATGEDIFRLQLETGYVVTRPPFLGDTLRIAEGIFFFASASDFPEERKYLVASPTGEVKSQAWLRVPTGVGFSTLTIFPRVRTGSLTISRIEASQIAGTFDITYIGPNPSDSLPPDGPVKITGSFIAVSASEEGDSSP